MRKIEEWRISICLHKLDVQKIKFFVSQIYFLSLMQEVEPLHQSVTRKSLRKTFYLYC